jgi:hypothetical protein
MIGVNPLHPRHPRSIVGMFITKAGYNFPYKQMRTVRVFSGSGID